MPKLKFWNEAIKVWVRQYKKPIGICFSMAIKPQAIFFLLYTLEHP
jgi:hypothetical protein